MYLEKKKLRLEFSGGFTIFEDEGKLDLYGVFSQTSNPKELSAVLQISPKGFSQLNMVCCTFREPNKKETVSIYNICLDIENRLLLEVALEAFDFSPLCNWKDLSLYSVDNDDEHVIDWRGKYTLNNAYEASDGKILEFTCINASDNTKNVNYPHHLWYCGKNMDLFSFRASKELLGHVQTEVIKTVDFEDSDTSSILDKKIEPTIQLAKKDWNISVNIKNGKNTSKRKKTNSLTLQNLLTNCLDVFEIIFSFLDYNKDLYRIQSSCSRSCSLFYIFIKKRVRLNLTVRFKNNFRTFGFPNPSREFISEYQVSWLCFEGSCRIGGNHHCPQDEMFCELLDNNRKSLEYIKHSNDEFSRYVALSLHECKRLKKMVVWNNREVKFEINGEYIFPHRGHDGFLDYLIKRREIPIERIMEYCLKVMKEFSPDQLLVCACSVGSVRVVRNLLNKYQSTINPACFDNLPLRACMPLLEETGKNIARMRGCSVILRLLVGTGVVDVSTHKNFCLRRATKIKFYGEGDNMIRAMIGLAFSSFGEEYSEGIESGKNKNLDGSCFNGEALFDAFSNQLFSRETIGEILKLSLNENTFSNLLSPQQRELVKMCVEFPEQISGAYDRLNIYNIGDGETLDILFKSRKVGVVMALKYCDSIIKEYISLGEYFFAEKLLSSIHENRTGERGLDLWGYLERSLEVEFSALFVTFLLDKFGVFYGQSPSKLKEMISIRKMYSNFDKLLIWDNIIKDKNFCKCVFKSGLLEATYRRSVIFEVDAVALIEKNRILFCGDRCDYCLKNVIKELNDNVKEIVADVTYRYERLCTRDGESNWKVRISYLEKDLEKNDLGKLMSIIGSFIFGRKFDGNNLRVIMKIQTVR